MRTYALPLLYLFFSITSVLVLVSLAPTLVTKQLTAILLGAAVFWGMSRLSSTLLYEHPRAYYAVSIFSLVLTLLLPTEKSTHRWIDLPLFSIQPSQFAFVLVMLAVTAWLVRFSILSKVVLLKVLLAILVPTVLIFLQPNFGTSLIFLGTLFSLIYWAGIPIRYVVLASCIFIFIAIGLWSFGLKEYQKSRITGFINTSDQSPAAYNAQQAIIAIGSGGLTGQGFGRGYQSQLLFLPEKHTDFIFASIAEEFGLLGSAAILVGYSILVGFLIWLAAKLDSAPRLFVLGAATFFLLQLTLHIGANLRLLPITGVPLPLLSYGGSSVVSFAILLGVCQQAIQSIKPEPHMFIH